MTLRRPLMMDLDGTPITGAAPVTIDVVQGQMTPPRWAATQAAYNTFCLAKLTAVGDYFVANRRLPDGTRVQMVSMQNRDSVRIWATDGKSGMEPLLHGFGVVTDWQDPRFYWKPRKTKWEAPGQVPVQLLSGEVTYNHVTYETPGAGGGEPKWEFYPLVHSRQASRMWGWAPYKGLELTHKDAALPEPGVGTPTNAIVPIALTYQDRGKEVRRSRHFAVDDWILAQDGKKLYAMEAVAPMTSNGGDPLRKLPPCTDATGTQVALQQWRRWLVSPMLQIYRFRLCSEVLERTSAQTYRRLSRSQEEFSTQLRLPAKPPEFGGLEEEPEEPHLSRMGGGGGGIWSIGTNSEDDQGRPIFTPDPYWSGRIAWVAYGCYFYAPPESETGEVISEEVGGWRQSEGADPDSMEYSKFLAIPEWAGVGHCKLINRLDYVPKVFAQAALKSRRFRANPGDLRNCYGLHTHGIIRRKLEHSIGKEPQLTLDFGWAQIKTLEAKLDGEYIAWAHIDSKTIKNSYIDLLGDREPPVARWYTHAQLDGIPDEDPGGATRGYTKLGATMSALVDFEGINSEFPGNGITINDESDKHEPTCTGEYEYKTRYILDFDNRMQFCACLRTEIKCTGASWSQIEGRYMGAIDDDGPSEYTVKIYFEIRVKQQTYEKLLFTETVSKNAFEFRAILYPNYLIWPADDVDRELWVFMPPELVPPMEAHMHLTNIARPQGVNPHLAGHDVPPPGVTAPTKQVSETQLEKSFYDGRTEVPHPRRPTGVLYARTFTFGEFAREAFWMFDKDYLKFDAPKNLSYIEPDTPLWHYFPKLGKAMTDNKKISIEFRDDQFVDWSDDIPTREGQERPALTERNIKVQYV